MTSDNRYKRDRIARETISKIHLRSNIPKHNGIAPSLDVSSEIEPPLTVNHKAKR